MATITTTIPYEFDDVIGYKFFIQSKYINNGYPSSKYEIIKNLPKEATFKIIGNYVCYYTIIPIKPEGYIITPNGVKLAYDSWDGWQVFDKKDISKLYKTEEDAIEAAEKEILSYCF